MSRELFNLIGCGLCIVMGVVLMIYSGKLEEKNPKSRISLFLGFAGVIVCSLGVFSMTISGWPEFAKTLPSMRNHK